MQRKKKKNPCFGIQQTLGKHLLCPADCGSIFPSKSSRDAWPEVRWIWWIRQNFVAQFIQLLRPWLCDVQSSIVVEKNWALSVDQCRLQALPFSEHLINLLSVLLRHNGFARIQKAVVDETSIRPPNSDHNPFFWCKFSFGKCFGASSWSNHWTGHRWLYKIHFPSHITVRSRNGSLLLCRKREKNTSKQ